MTEGFTVWFTGCPAAGKTTLAAALEKRLRRRGIQNVQRLDGDVVREDLTRDLGFSKKDRDENIRRVVFVAELLSNNGVSTLVSTISPHRAARNKARQRCLNFVEVYVKCPLDVLMRRDPKGQYARAMAGEIPNFTGISDPYEEPDAPDLVVETDNETIEESLQKVISALAQLGLVPHEVARRAHDHTKPATEITGQTSRR